MGIIKICKIETHKNEPQNETTETYTLLFKIIKNHFLALALGWAKIL